MSKLEELVEILATHMPKVMRWSGALAKQLRNHAIAVVGKTSGSANTDALTLADLSIQELIVSALRDADPLLRECRIEAEESTGDLECFTKESEFVIGIDPVDGTKQYRDKTGDGYAVMLLLRTQETVHYSLVYIPESGSSGTWVEVRDNIVKCGEDDWQRPARSVLDSLPARNDEASSQNIYLIGFIEEDPKRAEDVTSLGLKGFTSETMPGSIYELQASNRFSGSLIHSPNVYDFPVSLHIARSWGGDAVWVHNNQSVHFSELWLDNRADMLRLPGIVACSANAEVRNQLCELAKDWNPKRYCH